MITVLLEVVNVKTFCEVLNRKIAPAVKFYLAWKLVRDYGLTQVKAARILGLKQSAVNYAATGRRKPRYYDEILGVPGVREILDRLVEGFIEKGEFELCTLCYQLLSTGLYTRILEAVGEPAGSVKIPRQTAGG
ncbi:MAG: transcriptional regulator [Desulfurococcus sp.]|nr:transcriptional regulator [Desulfurococcus sp.]